MSEARPPVVGEPAAEFNLRATTGETVTLASLRGRNIVLFFMREFT
jgi:peroxiredoxin